MMCYKDITFCKFSTCQRFDKCRRALTPKVKKEAVKWWGSDKAPIAYFADEPECYRERKLK